MAAAFHMGDEIQLTPEIKAAFDGWLETEWAGLINRGIRVQFVEREVSLTEAVKALALPVLPGELRFLPVSTLGTAPVAELMTERQNLMLRAIHDAMHAHLGADDSLTGELATTIGHLWTAPPIIWQVLASEVIGQAAASIWDGEFPEQRLSKQCLSLLLSEGIL
jgi:hypothetical protein